MRRQSEENYNSHLHVLRADVNAYVKYMYYMGRSINKSINQEIDKKRINIAPYVVSALSATMRAYCVHIRQ